MKIVSIFSYFGKISRVRNFLGFYISFVCDFYFLPDCHYCLTQFNFKNIILLKTEKITQRTNTNIISMAIFFDILSVQTLSVFLNFSDIFSVSFISNFNFKKIYQYTVIRRANFSFLSVFGYQYTDKKYPKMAILIKKNL